MSMSDCEKCWQTPCVCGHEYKNYSVNGTLEMIEALLLHRIKEEIQIILNTLNEKFNSRTI